MPTLVSDKLHFREAALMSASTANPSNSSPMTLDEKARSVQAVLATEQPVDMPDFDRDQMVPESLQMAGARFRSSLPLLNSHSRNDVDKILGSVNNIRRENGQLVGTLIFANTEAGSNAFSLVRDSHLSGVSVGYRVDSKTFVDDGESAKRNGKTITGPINLVDAFTIKEVSLTPVQADENASVRSPVSISSNEDSKMSEKLMPTLSQQSEAYILTRDDANVCNAIGQRFKLSLDESVKLADQTQREGPKDALDAITIYKRLVLDTIAGRQPTAGAGIMTFGESASEKGAGEVGATLQYRALSEAGFDPADHMDERSIHIGSENRYRSLTDLAKVTLASSGVRNVDRLPKAEIARLALGSQRDAAWHNTASFAQLTLDASNKSLLAGYTEADPSWRVLASQGPSVPDFKNINRVQFGDFPNLTAWNDNVEPDLISTTDAKESYAVEALSSMVDFSWQLMVNDDMSSLSRVPAELGRAASRTINAHFVAVITTNANLQDGQALFSDATGNRKKDNLGTGGAISATTLAEGRKLMRLQVGLNDRENNASEAVLNLVPRFLLVPAALEEDALTNLESELSPAEGSTTSFSAANTFRSLTPVVEPILDATDPGAWYLFASPQQRPGIEVTFLQGQESPIITSEQDFSTWAMRYKVTQSFAFKALDFRPVFKNAGS